MFETIKVLLLFLWQLPQNLLGILYRDILTFKNKCYILNNTKDYEVYIKESSGSVTLGRYIFVSPRFTLDTIKHETGHVVQSKYLGPLYLLIIGIPSIIWAMIRNSNSNIRKKYPRSWFYTEKWADKLVK